MINIEDYRKQIKHSVCINDEIESADCRAILLDDAEGLAQFGLSFRPEELSYTDYFEAYQGLNKVLFIELSDMKELVSKHLNDISEKLNELTELRSSRAITVAEFRMQKKEFIESIWFPTITEIKLKKRGSVAVIERLLRMNGDEQTFPQYHMCVVLKNGTESRIIDAIKQRINGLGGKNLVCETSKVCEIVARF